MRRPLVAGAAVIASYAAVAGLTAAWSGRRVRPLFEGFNQPAAAYQWVKPPPEFAAANIPPKPYDADITLAEGQSPATVAASPDGQFIVNLSARALAAHAGDAKVHVHISALDPGTLGPTPTGRHPDGNAYLIALTYQPSGVAVGSLASPADIIMTAPGTTAALLYSRDGHTWTEIAAQQVGGPSTIGGSYAGNGHYLAAFSGASSVTVNAAKSGGGVWTVVIATGVGAAAVALGAFGLVRQGRRRSATTRARARRRRPPPKRR